MHPPPCGGTWLFTAMTAPGGLITGRATGRRDDADAIGAELARIWQERLRYQYRAGHTIETEPDQVTLRAVTQIAPAGLWVTATVQVELT